MAGPPAFERNLASCVAIQFAKGVGGRGAAGAAELLAAADGHLGGLTADRDDLSPHLRAYAAGGPRHLTAVGLRYTGQACVCVCVRARARVIAYYIGTNDITDT